VPVAIFAAWGAKSGLRTMVSGFTSLRLSLKASQPLSRFSFGLWAGYIPIVLNLIATVGWSTGQCIWLSLSNQVIECEQFVKSIASGEYGQNTSAGLNLF